MFELARLLESFYSTPWAMLDSHLNFLELQLLQAYKTGNMDVLQSLKNKQAQPLPESVQARTLKSASGSTGIGVLPIQGAIGHRADFMSDYFGWPTTERLGQSFQQMADDPTVGAIVLDIDSPGGMAVGNEELHTTIMKNRGKKPVVAVANGMAASAAYYIASAADEIVVIPSGQVGSIGTVMVHADASKAWEDFGVKFTVIKAGKYKWEGNSLEPLGEEAKAELQSMVNKHYDMFINAVAKGRDVSAATVKSDYGQGRMLMAKDAVKAGMANKVGTLDDTLARFGARAQSGKTRMEDEGAKPENQANELERLRLKNKLLEL